MKPILVTAEGLAEVFDVHRNTVRAWVKAGLPVRRRGRALSIDLAVAVRWVRARDQEAAEERLAVIRATPDQDIARARKLTAEARIAEANAAEREGALVPAALVGNRWAQMTLAAREQFLVLPAVAVQHGLVAAEREAELAQIVDAALQELAERAAVNGKLA